MSAHLAFKFNHLGWINPEAGQTLALHEEIVQKHGSVWWGRTSGISVGKLETLKKQLEDGIVTYAFLYEFDTPKKIHLDQKLWYRAKILEIHLGKPKNIELIPAYYRKHDDLEIYVRLSEITKIKYEPGQTPRLPGQATMRHVAFIGEPVPENLVSPDNKNSRLCKTTNDVLVLENANPVAIKKSVTTPDQMNLALKVIDLQEEVISLQLQIDNLKSYKEYYGKILSTDYLFSSEKFFETWIQDNMHKIFPELEVIDRQPYISWSDGKFSRLDLLAINKETKDLAIIEVKTRKRSKKSGYDQFVRYTSWVKRNLDQLKAKYSDYNLEPSSDPQFIIISDFVDEEMKAICKDHGITLIHIFGGLGIEKAS